MSAATLSPFQCSVHTHCTLCDGKGTPEEMAEAAFQAGVRYYGFSSHSHTPIPKDADYVLPADMEEYRRTVLALRERYAGRMEILLGIEVDSNADVSPEGFDYWIGSVHYVRADGAYHYAGNIGSVFHCIDDGADNLRRARDEAYDGDMAAVVKAYYADVARMAARKPTILGHIDIVTKLNRGNAFFDEDAPWYRAAALEALHAADPAATLLELNTGAMARGFRDAPYPARFLLEEWRRMGGRVILTADAHAPDKVVFGYGAAAAAAQAAGFTQCAVLTGDGPRLCELYTHDS